MKRKDYLDTQKYWENTFSKALEYDIDVKIPLEGFEEAAAFLGEHCSSILDFGCGNGKMLLRCLEKGAENVLGIDLSENAVSVANKVVYNNNLKNKARFKAGSLELLEKIDDNTFDGAILFNILDNIKPQDSKKLLKEISRVLKPGSFLAVKFNPYLDEKYIKENDLVEIDINFYKEDTGLFIWNLKDDQIRDILSEYFLIEKEEKVLYKKFNVVNRMYYLKLEK